MAETEIDWDKAQAEAADRWYEWFVLPGGQVRARCREDKKQLGWALVLDHRYGKTVNKHTRTHHAHPVVMNGALVQVWRCPDCKQEVVK